MLNIVKRCVVCIFVFLVCSSPAYGQESCKLVAEWYAGELNSKELLKVVKETVQKLRVRCPDLIRAQLKHTDPVVRYRFAWAIADLRAAEFTADMGERLRDSCDKVRNEAAWFLVELKVPNYQRVMSELLNDPSEKVRNEARAYMKLFGAPATASQSTSSDCGEMCVALKRVLAARGNDFAEFRGVPRTHKGGEIYAWSSTLVLPGATHCSISPKREYSKATFNCYLLERPLAEADRYFNELAARIRAGMPATWKAEDWMEGMTSGSSKKDDLRRFIAGPTLDVENDVYVLYFFLPRWNTRSSISIEIKGN